MLAFALIFVKAVVVEIAVSLLAQIKCQTDLVVAFSTAMHLQFKKIQFQLRMSLKSSKNYWFYLIWTFEYILKITFFMVKWKVCIKPAESLSCAK